MSNSINYLLTEINKSLRENTYKDSEITVLKENYENINDRLTIIENKFNSIENNLNLFKTYIDNIKNNL